MAVVFFGSAFGLVAAVFLSPTFFGSVLVVAPDLVVPVLLVVVVLAPGTLLGVDGAVVFDTFAVDPVVLWSAAAAVVL